MYVWTCIFYNLWLCNGSTFSYKLTVCFCVRRLDRRRNVTGFYRNTRTTQECGLNFVQIIISIIIKTLVICETTRVSKNIEFFHNRHGVEQKKIIFFFFCCCCSKYAMSCYPLMNVACIICALIACCLS